MSESRGYIHPTAVIDEPVALGEGVKIWHFCHVMSDASIGARTSLGQNVFVASGVSIGADVKIQNNVSIYAGVTIEDEVFCGPSCVFTNVGHPRAALRHVGPYETTLVRRGATIGANATIVCGSTLGRHCFIAAGAVVSRGEVPDYAMMVGVPARRVAWVSRHGERLSAPDPNGVMRCPRSGWRYVLNEQGCVRCLDWDEDRPLASDGRNEEWIPMLDLRAQDPSIHRAINEAISRVVASQVFIGGAEVTSFEQEIAEYLRSNDAFSCTSLGASLGNIEAIGVSSGTDALLLALMCADIGPGDEVITTPYSFVATAEVIARVGAKAVFVDIDPDTFLINVERISQVISARTKAILPVHLFGQMVPMQPLIELAKRHRLLVIEDAAQAMGATSSGRKAGTWGDFGCFSFFPSKNLGAAGDGGLLVCRSSDVAERARRLRNHGMPQKYLATELGGNHRLDALQAAVLRAKLPHLDLANERRRRIADEYIEAIVATSNRSGLRAPKVIEREAHVWHQLVLRSAERDRVRSVLEQARIASEVYYPHPLHLLPAFERWGYVEGDFPEAERVSRESFAIPVFPDLTEAQRARIKRCCWLSESERHGRPRKTIRPLFGSLSGWLIQVLAALWPASRIPRQVPRLFHEELRFEESLRGSRSLRPASSSGSDRTGSNA
ncbi:MAG: aminotransferase class I/II-fold pyridoxal phosphate-dependent enzyme [Polyangiaceae bacterium]